METITLKKELDATMVVEHCIENFDFLKVRFVMEYLDWKWASIDATPNTNQMKDWVRQLSNSCLRQMKESPKQKKSSYATGGFEVNITRDYEGCEPNNVEIKFVIESWDQQALEETLI
jgi:hypothetical protein